ncbi:diguanylate cyclase [Litoribrevibacter euphylliae]|uniref:diguanylate cyclase n=1 Tax=Litoribrevibacter euphylliae TaxID=1834034 RepID=A0ABV7H759_9GAMM
MECKLSKEQEGSISKPSLWYLAVYAIYVATGFLGIAFVSFPPGHLTAVWLPSGIAFLAILLLGPVAALPIFLGSLTIKLPYLYDDDKAFLSLLVLTLVAIIETVQPWLAHKLWNKHFQQRGISSGADVLTFFSRIAFASCAVTVWFIVVLFMVTGYLSQEMIQQELIQQEQVLQEMSLFQLWFENTVVITMAHTLGIFLVVALYQSYWLVKQDPWSAKEYKIGLTAITTLLVVCAISFSVTDLTLYLLLPIFLILIIHTGYAGSSVALTLVSIWAIVATANGQGPFVSDDTYISMIHIMMFVLCLGLTMQFSALTLDNLNANKREMVNTIEKRTEELEKKNRQLLELASTDHLTGLCNRRSFEKIANKELERAQRYQTPLSILALDLDYFKQINDTHGHPFGDEVLKAFTNVCLDCLRKTDLMARLGGEEFAVLLPETTEYLATNVGEKLRIAISEINLTTETGEVVTVTCSIGVTTATMQDDNIAMMLHRADEALYDAKKFGRNKVCTYKRLNDSNVKLPL